MKIKEVSVHDGSVVGLAWANENIAGSRSLGRRALRTAAEPQFHVRVKAGAEPPSILSRTYAPFITE